MKPSIVAPNLKRTVLTYLTSTFGLVEDDTAAALAAFFSDSEEGLFRGPYMRVRAPFRPAAPGWEDQLDWCPGGFTPHRHQALAWERLSTRRGRAPEPTVVATGTGSGKTESFLVPVLDHCARHAGEPGVKAVVVYPMNALATDQAGRLDAMLAEHPELADVTAGLYVGERSATAYKKLLTERSDMRGNPPDLLLTNYKMLDLLLARAEDRPLWEGSNLAFVVVDEFHTFNGAQGTDVAMLLRRLKAATGCEPAPVATSATLGEEEARARRVASDIFGTEFGPGSVIGEDRLEAGEYVTSTDLDLPEPSVHEIAALPDPYEQPAAISLLCEAVLGEADLTPAEAGERLRGHKFLHAVLDGFRHGRLLTADEFYGSLSPWIMDPWKRAWDGTGHESAVIALERLLALISWARNGKRPLLHVETHFWIRSVSRLLRSVPADFDDAQVEFSWASDQDESQHRLPAVHCRHCGRSGWMVKVNDQRPDQLKLSPTAIYQQSQIDKGLTRSLLAAYPAELERFDPAAPLEDNPPLRFLLADTLVDYVPGGAGVPVLVDVDDRAAARAERCPACGNDDAIRFIGAGLATLASVALTEVFQKAVDLDAGDQAKALVFNDSVQDAAHRAGFLSVRANSFSLRGHLARVLDGGGEVTLADLIRDAVTALADHPDALGGVIPADLHADPGIKTLLSGDDQGSVRTWTFAGRRIAMATMLEFGLRSYVGRTLERTGVVATVHELPPGTAEVLADILTRSGARLPLDPAARDLLRKELLPWHAVGVLDRLRMRGGIWHDWLAEWVRSAGSRRWSVWGGRPYGAPAFPRGVSAPKFMFDGSGRSQFDRVDTATDTWLTDWTRSVLGLDRAEARKYLRELMRFLADQGAVCAIGTAGGTVYAATAGHIRVRCLDEKGASESQVGCDTCFWQRTVLPSDRERWTGTPCPRWRCNGRMRPVEWHDKYYFDRYTTAGTLRLKASEHTGILTRVQREKVEQLYRDSSAWDAPNVLTATSTLELGIDIGDLSTVGLAGIPPEAASYVQRSGRGGRTTGNALTIAFADRRPRDLAFFDDPHAMINGSIRPPGARLEAAAILRRQYVAFLVDKAARGALGEVEPLPQRASEVFGPGKWLERFGLAALAAGPEHCRKFLALFADRIGPEVASGLTAWAGAGIARDLENAAAGWNERLTRLDARIAAIGDAIRALDAAPDSLPDKQRDLRVLHAERSTVERRRGDIEHGTSAHNALTELGLLPNYALTDTAMTLEASLTHVRQDGPDSTREYTTELCEYARPAWTALTEFAPGSTAYFRGYAHEVKGIELGGKDTPVIERWRVCPSCGSVAKHAEADTRTRCPRCGTNVSGVENMHNVAVPQTVYAYDRAADIAIDDHSDQRERRSYNTLTCVEAPDPASTWRSADGGFGFDYSASAIVRRLNLGLDPAQEHVGDKVPFAGADRVLNPFWVCTECGGAKPEEDPTGKGDPRSVPDADDAKRHHRHWCTNRDSGRPHTPVLLAHELDTEVLRFLLPMYDTEDTVTIRSFQAALQAGIEDYFEGDTSHLRTDTCTMADAPDPDSDAPRTTRVFTVLFDRLRSGTGYLRQLAEPDAVCEILQRALRLCEECDCGRACHRCLLRYSRERDYEHIDRRAAVALIGDRLLAKWDMEAGTQVGDISLDEIADSRLEERFNHLVHRVADETGAFTIAKGEKHERILTFTPVGGEVTRWRMRAQQDEREHGTRPDYTFTRLDGPGETVLLYLDGFDYHARPAFNRDRRDRGLPTRTGEDARQRASLIASGKRVFAATWHDVEQYGGSGAYVPLVDYAAQETGARVMGIEAGLLKEEVASNPLDFLFDYLRTPDADQQRHVARAAGMALIDQISREHEHPAELLPIDPSAAERAAAALAAGQEAPALGQGGLAGAVTYGHLRLAVAFDHDDPSQARVFAVSRFDDDPDTPQPGIADYRRDWQTWLRWSNMLQFLAPGDVFTPDTTGLPQVRLPAPVDVSFHRPGFLTLIVDEHSLDLAQRLHRDGAPDPEVGEEYLDGVPVELAWPRKRIAVLPEPDGPGLGAERLDEYRSAGWRADTATGWDYDELLHLVSEGAPR